MLIEEYVFIDAALKKVWDTFTDLTCWKDWSTVMSDISSDTGLLTEGKRFRFCIRPLKEDRVLLTSRETFSGAILKPLRIFFPRRKIRELSILMLHDIKTAAENEKSVQRLKDR